jgi:3-oxoacyl-(acyl-carrier-protein) synthase
MTMQPLPITGMGLVSPMGSSLSEYWDRLRYEHGSPVDLHRTLVDPGKVPNRRFYLSHVPASEGSGQSPGLAFELAACAIRQAVEDAALDLTTQRVGLVLGTGAGDIDMFERRDFAGDEDTSDVSAYTLAARLGQRLQFDGPVLSVSTACSASATAFALALELLEDHALDAVVVCGVEAVSRTTLAAFNKLQALDAERCRPFGDLRSGTVFGDGAAALVLHAIPRPGQRVYARVCGIGLTCDAYHPTAPRPDGRMIAAAARRALAQARASESAITLVVPHGTGTIANDVAEYAMLLELFGSRLTSIPMFPLKAKIGHTSGGAGAFSVLTLALMLHHQQVPPGLVGSLASEFELHIPRDSTLPVDARLGLVNAYSFGGNQVSLVLEAA